MGVYIPIVLSVISLWKNIIGEKEKHIEIKNNQNQKLKKSKCKQSKPQCKQWNKSRIKRGMQR